MKKETKFGYGFLFVGFGVPYLIEKTFGLSAAILVSVTCVLVAGVLLWSGHHHKEDGSMLPFKKWQEWLAFLAAFSTLPVPATMGFLRAARNRMRAGANWKGKLALS